VKQFFQLYPRPDAIPKEPSWRGIQPRQDEAGRTGAGSHFSQ